MSENKNPLMSASIVWTVAGLLVGAGIGALIGSWIGNTGAGAGPSRGSSSAFRGEGADRPSSRTALQRSEPAASDIRRAADVAGPSDN
jgi:hypothetical protein